MRFLVQWIASERQGESVIPVSFWYWSIGGSVIMCVYFIFKRDPVGILAYLTELADLHSQFDVDSKGRLSSHCCRALAASPRDGLTESFLGLFPILRFGFRTLPRR